MNAKSDKSYYRGARRDVFALVPAGARRVLEVGCGAGRFRANFPANVEYWGVEPVAEAAREAVGLTRVLVGTLDEVAASLPDDYFDLVVCNDVLEHMVDPQGALTTIRAKMAAADGLSGRCRTYGACGCSWNFLSAVTGAIGSLVSWIVRTSASSRSKAHGGC